MRKTIAPIALALLATAAAAQDVRQEDRRADRQEDRRVEPNDVRREDRQADRRAEANEVEVKLAIPRNADGTINQTTLASDIKAQVAAGATEIQFRGLTAQDAQALIDRSKNVLGDLSKLLPNDGVERQLRFRGAVDARVQRNDEGELRARIEGIDLGSLTPAQRADLARQLATQAGLDRLRIRGTDATGARVRVEFRDGRGIVKNEGRADRSAARGDTRGNARNERVARMDADDRRGRRGGADRPERAERAERMERAERPERVERAERPERVERVERPERVERAERVERVERVERPDRSGRH
jgi:hypothetical protein